MKPTALACLVPLALTALSQSALAQQGGGFTMTNSAQYAYALDSSEDKVLAYGADSKRLETLRLQHDSDYSLGSNFFLLDFLRSDKPLGGPVFGPNDPANYSYGDGNRTYFGVLGTELHASKVFGSAAGTGLIRDWGLSGRIERGGYYKYQAHEIGPQVHLNVPGFDTFKFTAWRRWKSDISGSAAQGGYDVGQRFDYKTHWLIGLDWNTRFQFAGFQWTSQAFVRYQKGEGGKAAAVGRENVSGVPNRLWFEPDLFLQINKNFAVGIRDYYLWQTDAIDNDYSTQGKKSHHVPQIVLRASI
jgi:hypothetical protein